MTFERLEQEFLSFLQIPSITNAGDELRATQFLEKILDEYGISHKRVSRVDDRPNLIAKINGKNPDLRPLVLISHIDVVDGDESKWQYPVFGAEIHDERIFARGTLDTKHLTMMELFGFLQIAVQKITPVRDIYFVATIDEEQGSEYGMGYVKKACPELFSHAIVINEGGGFPLLINGEQYLMVTIGEKAVFKVSVTAKGDGGHASVPPPIENQAMLKLANALRDIFADEQVLKLGYLGVVQNMDDILQCDEIDNGMAQMLYNYAKQGSVGMRNYTVGQRSNIIPASANAVLEFKLLPYVEQKQVEEFLQNKLANHDVDFEILQAEDGFAVDILSEQNKRLMASLEQKCAKFGNDFKVLPMLALGRTDGRFFGPEDSLVFGCSPVCMEDSFDVILPKVHGDNESISRQSFAFGSNVICQAILDFATKESI